MDIPKTIDLNKALLARIIAGLFAMLDAAGDAALARISVELHRKIARVLRPAESAVRRLIVVFARIRKVKAPPLRPRPVPAFARIVRKEQGQQRVSFQLFDPRQRFFRKPYQAKNRPQPRITVFGQSPLGLGEVRTISLVREPPPKQDMADGLTNPANLVRRLQALKAALEDLPGQAKRLVRALARRQKVPQLKLKMPLRPGRAPGYRVKPRLDIDHVLHECDWLAREVQIAQTATQPDTS